MNKRVVVAMSGGVDSSVAAALLAERGYEVIGMTMCFNIPEPETKHPICCGLDGIEDARKVARALNIKHYVLNFQKQLDSYVIRDFLTEYAHGRTPNPCVRCNEHLKFGLLLKKALSLDADFIATGHYARITKRGQYELRRGKDPFKDQSYFLYRLGQDALRHTLFPLGGLLKSQVRQQAKRFNLGVAEKAGSQEICFLAGRSYHEFLKKHAPKSVKAGIVRDITGREIGRHKGVAFHTIGQRGGLGIALGTPAYVAAIDPVKNEIIIGPRESIMSRALVIAMPHFVGSPIKKKVALSVKIRYNHPPAEAVVEPRDGKLLVQFRMPQFAVTPGQSAVLYSRERIVGGGLIERA